MSEVIKLSECKEPQVVVCKIEGIQAQAKALEDIPKEVYEIARKRGEDDLPNPPDIIKPTLTNQIKVFANQAGFDVGTNIRKIGEVSVVANRALDTATGAKDIATRAGTNATQALTDSAEAKVSADSAFKLADKASQDATDAIKASGLATTLKAGTVKPFANHFSVGADGELQIKREIFQYIQGLFDDCLKSVKQSLSDDQKQQVMQNLGAQGMMISLVRKDIVETLDGGQEKKVTVRFYRRAPSTDKIGVTITNRSEWREGDISRVVCSYNGYTTEDVIVNMKNYGSSPVTARFSVQATYEL